MRKSTLTDRSPLLFGVFGDVMSSVPVCNACISFRELTSCHSLSIWEFTLSPSAAAPPKRSIHSHVWWTEVRESLARPTVVVTSRLMRRECLPGSGWTSRDEVKQRKAEEEEEEDGEAQARHGCGSSRTGDRRSPCAAVEGTKHTWGGWIYSGPLCASLVTQHALAPEICYCPNIRKRWERWKGGVANNEPPVSGFWKIFTRNKLCWEVFPFNSTKWKSIECFSLTVFTANDKQLEPFHIYFCSYLSQLYNISKEKLLTELMKSCCSSGYF